MSSAAGWWKNSAFMKTPVFESDDNEDWAALEQFCGQ